MTPHVSDRRPVRNPVERFLANFDPMKPVIALVLAGLAFGVLWVARNQIVRPFDEVVTEQQCRTYGDEIERPLVEYERSNRFGLLERNEGFCRYGPGPNGEAAMTLTIEDTEPGPLYLLAKTIGIVLQLGIASIFLRLTVDPVFDLYRSLRARFG